MGYLESREKEHLTKLRRVRQRLLDVVHNDLKHWELARAGRGVCVFSSACSEVQQSRTRGWEELVKRCSC